MKDLLIIFGVLLLLLIIISALGGSIRHTAGAPSVHPRQFEYFEEKDEEEVAKKGAEPYIDQGGALQNINNIASQIKSTIGGKRNDKFSQPGDEEEDERYEEPPKEDPSDADARMKAGAGTGTGSTLEGFESPAYASF